MTQASWNQAVYFITHLMDFWSELIEGLLPAYEESYYGA